MFLVALDIQRIQCITMKSHHVHGDLHDKEWEGGRRQTHLHLANITNV